MSPFSKKEEYFFENWMDVPTPTLNLSHVEKEAKICQKMMLKIDTLSTVSFFENFLGENIRVIKCFIMSYKAFQLDAGKVHSFQRKKKHFSIHRRLFLKLCKEGQSDYFVSNDGKNAARSVFMKKRRSWSTWERVREYESMSKREWERERECMSQWVTERGQ